MTQVYMHKQTGDLAIVEDCYVLIEFSNPLNTTGCFTRVGVLFENEHGVTFLLPDAALEYFEHLGEF